MNEGGLNVEDGGGEGKESSGGEMRTTVTEQQLIKKILKGINEI